MEALQTVALSCAIAAITGPAAEAWHTPPRPVRSEWCCQHIRIPPEIGAQPGPFTLGDRPYFAEILDAVDDPEVRQIDIVGAPQVGKTTFLHALILSQGEVDRAPMMFAGPDKLYAHEERDRIYLMAESSPALRDRIPPARRRNDRAIDLDRRLVYLAWSGSTQRLSGRSCKVVLCSEIDRWATDPDLAAQRVKAFRASSTVINEGSPIGAASTIWSSYQQSDRRTWRARCPKCGHHQELQFFPHRKGPYAGFGGVAGIKRGDEWLSAEEARKAAYYLCEKGCKLGDDDKPALIAGGRWAAEGQTVTKAGKLAGKPANPGRRRGYHLSGLLSPASTWGDLAEDWIRKRDSPGGRERFWNDVLGKPYKARGKTPRWEELGRRLAGAHQRGHVPPWAYFLTGAADVQEGRVYWVVRAWGDGSKSALVDFGEIPKPAGDEGETLGGDLLGLDDVLDRRWPVAGENPLGYQTLMVCRFGVDCGYRTREVLDFVRSHPGDRLVAVAGDPQIAPGTLWRRQQLERNLRTGKTYPAGTERWGIDTAAYKADLAGRWSLDLRGPGVWWLPETILETGEDYLRQITNEREVLEDRKGKKRTVWEMISTEVGNHYFDAEVYARCLADQVVGLEWSAEQWPWIRSGRPDDEPVEPAIAGRGQPVEDFAAR